MFLGLNLFFLNCFFEPYLVVTQFFGVSINSLERQVDHLDIFLISLALDLDDSRFLASCLTLLARNFSRSMLESLIASETNSSSLRKNQTISLCSILAVSFFHKIDLCLRSIIPLIHTYISLSKAG